MITTNLTLTNGATSEISMVVTGVAFEVDSKLAVNPAVTFPFTVAINSSEVMGIDFDETLHTGDYTEQITINVLGGHDIVHTVNMVDTTVVCDDGMIPNGCFNETNIPDELNFSSTDGVIEDGRLKVTTAAAYCYARYDLDTFVVGNTYEFSFDCEAGTNVGYYYSAYDYTNGIDVVPVTEYVPADGRVSFTFIATAPDMTVFMIRDGVSVYGDCFFDNIKLVDIT